MEEIMKDSYKEMIKTAFETSEKDKWQARFCQEYEMFDKLLAKLAFDGEDEKAMQIIEFAPDFARRPDIEHKHFFVLSKEGYKQMYLGLKKSGETAKVLQCKLTHKEKECAIKSIIKYAKTHSCYDCRGIYLLGEKFLDFTVEIGNTKLLETLILELVKIQKEVYSSFFPSIKIYEYVDELIKMEVLSGDIDKAKACIKQAIGYGYGTLYRPGKAQPYQYTEKDYLMMIKEKEEIVR